MILLGSERYPIFQTKDKNWISVIKILFLYSILVLEECLIDNQRIVELKLDHHLVSQDRIQDNNNKNKDLLRKFGE